VNDHDVRDERLQAQARRLGAHAAERLDVERTAAAVLRRLREQPATTAAWWARPAWLRIAAAVVLLLGGGVVYRGTRVAGPATAVVGWDGLNGLSSDQLRALIQSLDEPVLKIAEEEGLASSQEAGLEDLSAGQLRELLRSLEG
jgi:hypothetical protein